MSELTVKSIIDCEAQLAGKILHLQRASKSLQALIFKPDTKQQLTTSNPVIVVWVDNEILTIECKSMKSFPEKIQTWNHISRILTRKLDFTETKLINNGISYKKFMKIVS